MTETTSTPHTGSCLCRGVTFEITGALPHPDACHCTQCRKTTGHFLVSTDVKKEALTVVQDDTLGWYASSEKVRRGFCTRCGSTLFWDPLAHDFVGVAMGAFDAPTRTKIGLHIHVASKGDYYEIAGDAPRYETVPPRGER